MSHYIKKHEINKIGFSMHLLLVLGLVHINVQLGGLWRCVVPMPVFDRIASHRKMFYHDGEGVYHFEEISTRLV